MKRPFLISAYIVSAALFIFYIWVLWNARTPEVNLAYRMYYINRELEKWPGIEGFDYVVGIPVYMNQEQKGVVPGGKIGIILEGGFQAKELGYILTDYQRMTCV